MSTSGRVRSVLQEPGDTLGGRFVRMVLALAHVHWRSGDELPAGAAIRLCEGELVLEGVTAIIGHLERRHGHSSVIPEQPSERARSFRLFELSLPVLGLARYRHGHAAPEPARIEALEHVLAQLEACLRDGASVSPFGVGKAVSIGSLAVTVVAREAEALGINLHVFGNVHRVQVCVGGLVEVRRAYLPSKLGYVEHMRPERRDAILDKVLRVVGPLAEQFDILGKIGWSRAVEEQFFAEGAARLPRPEYAIDRSAAREAARVLEQVHAELLGEHVMLDWLRATVRSFIDGYRMLAAVGTPEFYHRSLEIYGGASTTAFDRDSTNLDLARHIERRVGDQARFVETAALDTEAFIAFIEAKLAAREPRLPLQVVRDDKLSAKVLCGRTRLRVRPGAKFGRAEAEGLWLHEVETHALTAQNGWAQARFPLLRNGGPRTTRTQEGLAVFSELYGGALSSPRLLRIAERVRLVGMAEDGASFLDLYRHLTARGMPERDAYLDAQRICRGGLLEGGGPFTKDACYLAGLLDTYTALRSVLQLRSPLIGELYVSGRIHSDDLLAISWLRHEGVLERPRFLPGWAHDWDALLAHFAFTSFLSEVEVEFAPRWPADVERFMAESAQRFDLERSFF